MALRCPRPHPGRPSCGFTLLELVLALAIGVLLLGLAAAAYGDWIADAQLMNHARLLATSMNEARAEAIKRGHRVNLCKSPDGRQCTDSGRWDQGFLLHGDHDVSGEVESPDAVIRFEPAARDVRVDANRPLQEYVSFTSLGQARMLTGALQMGTFTVCKQGRRAVEVVLVASGRVRMERTRAVCP